MSDQEHNKSDHRNNTSILQRKLPTWVTGVVFITFFLLVFYGLFIMPPRTPHAEVNNVYDMSNARAILNCLYAYAADNEGQFPAHIALASDYFESDEDFISRFDDPDTTPLTIEHPTPNTRYRYGSYWFYPTVGLSFDDIQSNHTFIIVYREPRPDSERFIAGFLDGHVETLVPDDFHAMMEQQDALMKKEPTD